MTDEHQDHQIPIWFFIGMTLLAYGALIFLYGLISWGSPDRKAMAMGHLHADVWWGAGMAALGALYTVKFRPRKEPSGGAPNP
jgi:hypothetical protein